MLAQRVFASLRPRACVVAASACLHTLAATPSRATPAARPVGTAQSTRRWSLPLPSTSPARSFSSLSLSAREKAVLKLLQAVRHPAAGPSGDDIVFSGHVRSVSEKEGVVSIVLPLDDSYRALKKQISERLEAAGTRPDWLKGVRVVMEAVKDKSSADAPGARTAAGKVDGLARVRHIIAVSSCKGGVGKSTVAVNLAYALQQLQVSDAGSSDGSTPLLRDARVGLLDADVYGPSLPTMVSPRDTTLRYDEERRIIPPVYQGIKTMSYGYVKGQQSDIGGAQETSGTMDSAAAASSGAFIRGPLASAAVKQLASETAWGPLDFLVVDFPPGTGDIQLTLTQLLRLSGAVVVTTPGRLSFVDVAKGMSLFTRTGVRVLSVVENMSYFTCGTCDTKHRLFGEQSATYLQQLQHRFGSHPVVELPIWPAMAKASDSGDPIMLSHDEANAPIRAVYTGLANSIQQQISGGDAATAIPTLRFDAPTGNVILTEPAAATPPAPGVTSSPSAPPSSVSVSARALRLACRCAGCVDELSGAPKLDPARVPADVRPLGMQPRGNYAVAVHWSDGHASSLYPFDDIRKIAAEATTTAAAGTTLRQ